MSTVEAVLDRVESVDANLAAALRDEIGAIHARTLPRIAVIGEFSSGKTSLVKRLCVETGILPPSAARVAASPSTLGIDEAALPRCVLVDTPGLGSHDPGDSALALETALDADAVVLVVPPSLFTGDTDALAAILTGAAWQADAPPLLVVVNRIDAIGIDPADDANGFARLLATKRDELERRLRELGLTEMPPVCFAASDPYQAVGDSPCPGSDDYARAEWDGISGALSALADLSERARGDRERRLVRHVLRRIDACVRDARAEAGALLERARELEDDTSVESQRARLRAIYERREAEARSIAQDAVRALVARVREGQAVGEADVRAVTEALAVSLSSWANETAEELRAALAGSGDDSVPQLVPAADSAPAWKPSSPEGAPAPWAAHGQRVSRVLRSVGGLLDGSPARSGRRANGPRSGAQQAIREEGAKTAGKWRDLGGVLKRGAPLVPDALALIDVLRRNTAESRERRRRLDAAAELSATMLRWVDDFLDGTREEPGIRAWWRAIDEALAAQLEESKARLDAARARARLSSTKAGELEAVSNGARSRP